MKPEVRTRIADLLAAAGHAEDADRAWLYRAYAAPLLFGEPVDGEDPLISDARNKARRERDFALFVDP